ncbi:hypothetical protein VTL71DRAFT_12043 [Oculimacula yallundae]|uniref:Uncharacterized protein n=1 Tax=Oculimacula yallundae TaxID=86028 RepID=A0ABR4CS55_9HELO
MSSSHDSDISSFAEWEAQERVGFTIEEREQKLLDMEDPARVWKDRDSSNDARSSEGESASEVGLGENGGVSITNAPLTPHDLSLLQASVQEFAREHPFWMRTTLEDDDEAEEAVAEFEYDVYEFATEAGLSVHLAKVEVMRAMGAWKMERGLDVGVAEGGEATIEGIFEKVLQTVELVADAIGGGDGTKKRRREQKVREGNGLSDGVVESIEGEGGENKEPKAKRQRRREKKRKLEDGPISTADAMEVSKDEEPKTKAPKRQRSRRKLGEEIASTTEAIQSAGVVSNAIDPVIADNEIAGQNTAVISEEKKKLNVDKDLASKPVSAATPATEPKSAKRIRNEKKKEKKKRAKLGPTTSSHFAQPETSNSSSTKAVSPTKDKIVTTQTQTGDTQMPDVPEKEYQTSVDDQGVQDQDIEQLDAADRAEKKKRKKKRNKNRLSEVELGEAVKAADERSARKNERSAIPKDGASEPLAKKKRVRSRIMKGGGDELSVLEKTTVLESGVEAPVESAKSSETTIPNLDASPVDSKKSKKSKSTKPTTDASGTIKSAEEELLVRPLRTFDSNGVFGTTDASNPDLPQIAIEAAAIEQAPVKEKSRKRNKKSEPESGVDAEVESTQIEVTNSTEAEPLKKKPRDRKRKSLSKLLDNPKDIEVPSTEALIELPDTNSEKNKKHKRDKSSKRSSVGAEVNGQASEEASNSRHS